MVMENVPCVFISCKFIIDGHDSFDMTCRNHYFIYFHSIKRMSRIAIVLVVVVLRVLRPTNS